MLSYQCLQHRKISPKKIFNWNGDVSFLIDQSANASIQSTASHQNSQFIFILELIIQLYEQGADVRRIGKYVRNWQESGWRNVGRNNQSAPASPYPPLCNTIGVAYHLRRRLLKNHIVQNFVWQSLI